MHEILLFSMHPSCTPCHRFGIPLFSALFVHCSIGFVIEKRFLFADVKLSLQSSLRFLYLVCILQVLNDIHCALGSREKVSLREKTAYEGSVDF